MVAELRTGLAKGDNFSVGCGVGVGEVAIPALAYDLALMDDDGTDRNLARFERALRRPKGLFHPEFVAGVRGPLVATG
jgi:hypothetical protein